MASKAGRLFGVKWVHVFEEDTPQGAVYRPEDADIPLSRRPRERLELAKNGSAKVFTAGPDDRPVAKTATWRKEGGAVTIRTNDGAELRIIDRTSDRLVIQAR